MLSNGPVPIWSTNLLCLFGGYFSCSPGNNVEVDDWVQNKEEVHRRDGQQVDDSRDNAPEFLRVQTGCYEEGTGQGDEENCRRWADAVLTQLQRRSHDYSHHDECVAGGQDLGNK